MKRLILVSIWISSFIYAGEICGDVIPEKESAFNWAESSFNPERAKESMAALQNSIDNDGVSNICGLHNALQIVEGYILKQQAQSALLSDDVPDMILEMKVGGFCEFVQSSKPCE